MRVLCRPTADKSDGPLRSTSPIAIAVSPVAVKSRAPAQANRLLGQALSGLDLVARDIRALAAERAELAQAPG